MRVQLWFSSEGFELLLGLYCQARKLESELDVKLASFRRVGTPKDGQGDGSEAEIARLLQQLNEVNKHMQSWVSNAGSDVLSHTLTRHRNILHELSQVRFLNFLIYFLGTLSENSAFVLELYIPVSVEVFSSFKMASIPWSGHANLFVSSHVHSFHAFLRSG